MRLEWTIEGKDVEHVRTLMAKMATNAFVVHRQKNLEARADVTRQELWFQMLSARLTSAQRSGPGSHVSRFVRTNPFPLALDTVSGADDPAAFIAGRLRHSGGIRFADKIGLEMAGNLKTLESGGWEPTLAACNRLTKANGTRDLEVEVAGQLIAFIGFGPKQSRNVLQSLGLTRFEIPIDSRLTDWLNDFGFPVKLTAGALADPNYYALVSDGINRLCGRADVFPCMFDAAIFTEVDGDGWTPENVTD